jgi:hypothetical protein
MATSHTNAFVVHLQRTDPSAHEVKLNLVGTLAEAHSISETENQAERWTAQCVISRPGHAFET